MRFLSYFVGSVWILVFAGWLSGLVNKVDYYSFVSLPTEETPFEVCMSAVSTNDFEGWKWCFTPSHSACKSSKIRCSRMLSKAAVRFAGRNDWDPKRQQLILRSHQSSRKKCFQHFKREKRADCLVWPSQILAFSSISDMEPWEIHRLFSNTFR